MGFAERAAGLNTFIEYELLKSYIYQKGGPKTSKQLVLEASLEFDKAAEEFAN